MTLQNQLKALREAEMDKLQGQLKRCRDENHGEALARRLRDLYERTYNVSLEYDEMEVMKEHIMAAIAMVAAKRATGQAPTQTTMETLECTECSAPTYVCYYPTIGSGWGSCHTCGAYHGNPYETA